MRTRAVLSFLTFGLAASVAAGGCQIIAGLSSLTVGSGGSGGAGTGAVSSASAGTTASASTGPGSAGTGGGCTASTQCSPTTFCEPQNHTCEPCGSDPPPPTGVTCTPGMRPCNACDDAGTCLADCSAPNSCNASFTLQGPGTVVFTCDADCNGITITCTGPHECDLVCSNGGCTDLTFQCSQDGPCQLTCSDMSSCQGVKFNAGDNKCLYGGPPGPMVVPVAGHCGCM
jgi:hypothetical protein